MRFKNYKIVTYQQADTQQFNGQKVMRSKSNLYPACIICMTICFWYLVSGEIQFRTTHPFPPAKIVQFSLIFMF